MEKRGPPCVFVNYGPARYRAFNPASQAEETICVDKAALRLGICVGSVYKLIRAGVLPATQLIPSAPWQIPVGALESEAVNIGVQQIAARRPPRINAAIVAETVAASTEPLIRTRDPIANIVPARNLGDARLTRQALLDNPQLFGNHPPPSPLPAGKNRNRHHLRPLTGKSMGKLSHT
jgi:hypothetical protein